MKQVITQASLFLLVVGAVSNSFAAPMGFKNSWMLMGDFSKTYQELGLNYATTANDAFGVSASAMQTDNSVSKQQNLEAVYTRKMARWNLPEAQANIWFLGGLGNVSGNDFGGSRLMASPGIQVDYETTGVYASATTRLYRADGITHDYGSARLGFSFYEVDYDEIQPWLVVEVRRMAGLSDKTEVTPMLRLIHKRFFLELGVNNSAQGRFNFMYIF